MGMSRPQVSVTSYLEIPSPAQQHRRAADNGVLRLSCCVVRVKRKVCRGRHAMALAMLPGAVEAPEYDLA
eukprot:9380922-Alexandrium_andersonii.AAC.1